MLAAAAAAPYLSVAAATVARMLNSLSQRYFLVRHLDASPYLPRLVFSPVPRQYYAFPANTLMALPLAVRTPGNTARRIRACRRYIAGWRFYVLPPSIPAA